MSEPQNDGQIAVVFIEVLFAIVVGISATKMTVQPWFNPGPSATFHACFALDIGVLLLGHTTLIASWLGYHTIIRKEPHKIETFRGW